MDRMKWAGVVLLCLLALQLSAQKKKKDAPNSLGSDSPSKVYAPKAPKKQKSSKTTYDARDKYFDRMEENAKKRRKNESNADNPQYTKFQYFGHKKPPKKRPPEKMKYCKICGIRH
ncbi:MAG: hypothetical protein DI538_19520 [Azospira oryzae]|jgi:hypothetical protein|nr:MAG: hypothetical protein DI538_19520 [Azospira oryzae]